LKNKTLSGREESGGFTLLVWFNGSKNLLLEEGKIIVQDGTQTRFWEDL
jgi:hypothetical protein